MDKGLAKPYKKYPPVVPHLNGCRLCPVNKCFPLWHGWVSRSKVAVFKKSILI